MRIMNVLDASTIHLPVACRAGHWPAGIITEHLTYGWLVWVPDSPLDPGNDMTDADENTIDKENEVNYPLIREMQIRARLYDCDWIMFDADAEMVDGWAVYGERER